MEEEESKDIAVSNTFDTLAKEKQHNENNNDVNKDNDKQQEVSKESTKEWVTTILSK